MSHFARILPVPWTLAGALLCLGGAPAALAGTLSWFDDPAFPGAYAPYRLPGDAAGMDRRQFSIHFGTGSEPGQLSMPPRLGREEKVARGTTDRFTVFGDFGPEFWYEPPATGLSAANRSRVILDPRQVNRSNFFGIKWRHRLNPGASLSIATRYGGNLSLDQSLQSLTSTPLDTSSTMTSLSLMGAWVGQVKPTLIGSLFIGDEIAHDEAYARLGRKYYGFTLGGNVTLFHNHMPYVSFKLQRSDYFSDDGDFPGARERLHSRLSAGWNWQVQPNWSMRAGADFTVDDFELNFYKYDRSRVFFSTRFDFR